MPGRQLTTTPVLKKPKAKGRTKKRSLNALAIAEQQEPQRVKIRSHRLGESAQATVKRKREVSEQEGDDEGLGRQASKRARPVEKDRFGNEIERGSDSDGNEWKLGQVDSAEDSDLDSDEALGESDEERFEGFAFRGGSNPNLGISQRKSNKSSASGGGTLQEVNLDEKDDVDGGSGDESDGFGGDAVDLATMLDDSGDDEPRGPKRVMTLDSVSEGDDEHTGNGDSVDDEDSELSISDDEDGKSDPTNLQALEALVSSISAETKNPLVHRISVNDAQESTTPSEFGLNPRQKLTIADLLPSVTDPHLRKSLRLLSDGSTRTGKSSGIPKKLEVPLAKRQQDRLDRTAAYEKSKETLNRWIDTVTHNRRAEHLSFPLQDPDAIAAKTTKRLLPISHSLPLTDLEATIQNILLESGLITKDGKSQDDQIQAFEELQTNKLPIEEVQARRTELRKARELLFREEIRAKRIKKIKSKSYRRVHRRERERKTQQEKEALAIAGGNPSEDEQERNDRRRAEERMGARHRESKWARSMKDSGRAVWDEDARSGVTEMARRNEELRRRIEGREVRNGEDDSLSSDADSSDEAQLSDASKDSVRNGKLQDRLRQLKTPNDSTSKNNGQSALSSMKFMQRAEASRREQNDADIERIRREIAGEDSSNEEENIAVSGRRKYGPARDEANSSGSTIHQRSQFEERPASDEEDVGEFEEPNDGAVEIDVDNATVKSNAQPLKSILRENPRNRNSKALETNGSTQPTGNPWLSSSGIKPSKKDRHPRTSDEAILISNTPSLPTAPPNHISADPPPTPRNSSKSIKPPTSPSRSPSPSSSSFSGFSSAEDTSPEQHSSRQKPDFITRNRDLIRQAFAGDEVLADFEQEKQAAIRDDEEKVIDNTLPGWGAWTGEGISKKEQKRNRNYSNKNRDVVTEEGIKPEKRQDAKLERVVINEKRVKKVFVPLPPPPHSSSFPRLFPPTISCVLPSSPLLSSLYPHNPQSPI